MAAAVTDQFEPTFTDDQRRDLDLLTHLGPASFLDAWLVTPQGLTARSRGRRVGIAVAGLGSRPVGGPVLLGTAADREIAGTILDASIAAENGNDRAAVAALQAAAHTVSIRLRKAVADRAGAVADRLVWAGPDRTAVRSELGLAAAHIATEVRPDHAPSLRAYAAALFTAGRAEDALEAYNRVIGLDPRNGWNFNNRGNALIALKRYEDALASYEQAVALAPRNRATLQGRANAFFALGRYAEALTSIEEALALNPHNGDTLHARGVCLRVLGRSEEALDSYAQALRAETTDQWIIHGSRGVALVALGRFEEAAAAFDQAVAGPLHDASAHENRGICLAAVGALESALAELDEAAALEPDGVGEARTWAGAILWHQGKPDLARKRFERVVGRVTGCTPFRTAEMEAIALCGLGNPIQAEQHLLEATHLCVPGDANEPRQLYDLLSDPPLPGIDRLRAIAERRI